MYWCFSWCLDFTCFITFYFKCNSNFLWRLFVVCWVSYNYSFCISTWSCSCWSLTIFPRKCCCTTIVIWELWSTCFISYISSWICIKTSANFLCIFILNGNSLEFWTFVIDIVICETSHDVCSSTNKPCSLHTCNIVKRLRHIHDWCVIGNRPHNITKRIIISSHRIQSLWTFCGLSCNCSFIALNCWISSIFVKLSQTLSHFWSGIDIHPTFLTHQVRSIIIFPVITRINYFSVFICLDNFPVCWFTYWTFRNCKVDITTGWISFTAWVIKNCPMDNIISLVYFVANFNITFDIFFIGIVKVLSPFWCPNWILCIRYSILVKDRSYWINNYCTCCKEQHTTKCYTFPFFHHTPIFLYSIFFIEYHVFNFFLSKFIIFYILYYIWIYNIIQLQNCYKKLYFSNLQFSYPL